MKNDYQTATIVKIEIETPIVKNFILDIKLLARPGQYVMVWIPGQNEKPFGVMSTDPFSLSIAKVGPFSTLMHNLAKGDKLSFRGPYGNGFTLKGKKIVLVGGGYGAVPLYFLASTIGNGKRKNITVILGAKTKSLLPFVAKFKALGCKTVFATDDGSYGIKGFTTDVFDTMLKTEKIDSVYTCGPEIMMRKIADICYHKKIFCQVSMEKYFKCGGLGLCGECNCKGKLVCVDGPVFNGKFLVE